MPTHLIQPTFSGGEFTPSLYSRVDLQKYSTGLKTCKNFIVHPHGGASNRPGTKYIAAVKDSAVKTRLIPFEYSIDQAYVLEFGDKYIRFFTNNPTQGQIAVTADYRDDYNPATLSYLKEDFLKLGYYAALTATVGKILYINAPYGTDTSAITVRLEENTGVDDPAVTYAAGLITIKLAETTGSKNTAAAIQILVRAATSINFCVTENAAYLAARPSDVTTPTTTVFVAGGIYRCILAYTDASVHTHFPGVSTTQWEGAQTIYQIATPFEEADLPYIKFTQSADVMFIVHPDFAPKSLTRYGHDDWELTTLAIKDGPFKELNEVTTLKMNVSAITGTPNLISSSAYFNANHVGTLFKLVQPIPGQTYTNTVAESGLSADANITGTAIACGKTWRLVTHGLWQGTISVERSTDSGSTWENIRSFSSRIINPGGGAAITNSFNANTYGVEDEVCQVRAIYFYDYGVSGISLTVDLTTDPFIQTGIVKVTSYTNTTQCVVSIEKAVGSITATADWAEGSWGENSGYPTTITFYQDRLIMGGTEKEPQTVWSSQTGDYVNFGTNDPIEASDAISINVPSRRMNTIHNLINLSDILALTAGSEWSMGPSGDGIFSPTSLGVKCEGYRGSSLADPITIQNRAVFVQPMGTVICDIGYDFAQNGYAGDPLSLFSNHLFQGYTITEMAYQQEPNSIVWCVRSDGKLIALTYMRQQEVLAWHWHETDGEVESICSIPGDGYNELWMIVKRGSTRYVEYMVDRNLSDNVEDQYFVDCGISYDDPKTITVITKATECKITCSSHGFVDGDSVDLVDIEGMTELNDKRYVVSDKTTHTFKIKDADGNHINSSSYTKYTEGGKARKATTTITGLTHLEGKTVSILADGSVLPTSVVSSGSITLTSAASRVHVGLAYTSDLETLNIELPSNNGTTQDRKKKINNVNIRFLNSKGGWIGQDEDTLVEMVQRSFEPYDAPTELFTGDYQETLNSEYEYNGRIFFRQLDPLPVTILAFMPVVTQGG